MQTFSLAIECTLNLAVNFAGIKESPVLLALLSAKACAVLEMSLLSQKGYQGLSQFSDGSSKTSNQVSKVLAGGFEYSFLESFFNFLLINQASKQARSFIVRNDIRGILSLPDVFTSSWSTN